MERILVIEDEKKVLEVLESYLIKEGYEPVLSSGGAEGLELFYEKKPDLVVLDLMLPDLPGEEICREIKNDYDVPIIMLTAKSSVDERIKGLSIGADDYLVKPFSPRELMMRIKVLLKRYGKIESIEHKLFFNDSDLCICKDTHEIYKKNKIIKLTPAEYKIISFLADNRGMNFTREAIIDKVFGLDFEGYDRTIDAHIKNIRKKIENDPKNPEYIKTVFGFGYKFEGEPDEKKNKIKK